MIPLKHSLLSVLAAISIAGTIVRADIAPLLIEEITTIKKEEPRFPATMRAIGVKEGNVSLVVSIDEFGAVTDTFVVESSRRAFAQSALKSIANWSFEPAQYNGEHFPSTIRIEMDFKLGRNLKWQTFTAPVETNITQNEHYEAPITAVALEKLDNIPLPLEIVEPEQEAQGLATIEFYIDELGNVRCPKLIAGNNLNFGRMTINAVSKWRFQPPVSEGIHTNTFVRQTFRYVDGRLATSKPL